MSDYSVLIWFLLGMVLLIAELAMPGIVLLFFGIGAWVTALLLWLGVIDSLAAKALALLLVAK